MLRAAFRRGSFSVVNGVRAAGGFSRSNYDVIVVGSGAMGASSAYHIALADPSLKVCVVERDTSLQHASAVLSAGGIRQQFSLAANVQLSMYGIDFLRRIPVDLAVPGQEVPDIQFKEQGYLFLASADSEATLRRNHATQRACGVDWTTLLSPTELKERFPWMHTEDVALGCVGEHSEGWFDPWAYVMALKAKATHLGVEFVKGEVIGVETAKLNPEYNAGARKLITSAVIKKPNTRTTSSSSSAGAGNALGNNNRSKTSKNSGRGKVYSNPISSSSSSSSSSNGSDDSDDNMSDMNSVVSVGCGELVNCAGAFAAQVVAWCGDTVAPLPVAARRRTVFSVQSEPAEEAPCATTTPLVVCPETGAYFRPDGATPGRFLCGVSPPKGWPDPDDHSVSALEGGADHALFEEIVWPTLYKHCPAFAALKVKGSWAGFYEYNTMDQNAILGRHPHVPNMLLCNGFSGHGLQQSPGAGRAIAELITKDQFVTVDASCFGFDRVLKNKPLFEENIV